VEYTHLEACFQRVNFDHIVYCFSSNRLIEYGWSAQRHYLSFVPGINGIVSGKKPGEFLLKGRIMSCSSFAVGTIVSHSLLCGDNGPYDSSILWYTQKMDIHRHCSMIPLSSSDFVGTVDEIYISDKLDGETLYFSIFGGIVEVFRPEFSNDLYDSFSLPWPNQVLVCEMVGRNIIITEALVHPSNLFSEWCAVRYPVVKVMLKGKEYVVKRKPWYDFPLNGKWEKYADSGEGVVFKNRNCVLGYHSLRYGKLETYYLKLPQRVSYEDRIERLENQLVGLHGIYLDPDKVFVGGGVYEILMKSRTLRRARGYKKECDPHWYVVSLAHPPKFFHDKKIGRVNSPVFRRNRTECDYLPSDGGVIRMSNISVEQIPAVVVSTGMPNLIKNL